MNFRDFLEFNLLAKRSRDELHRFCIISARSGDLAVCGIERECACEDFLRLIAVRRVKAPQGRWLSWIETEFSWTDRTALNFMRVAEHFKSETVSDLPIDVTALYLLAGPSVPQTARDRPGRESRGAAFT